MRRLLMTVLSAFLVFAGMNITYIQANADTGTVRILFTHDLHDHIEQYKTLDEENNVILRGGYEYLSTAITEYADEDTVILDAGSFSAGTMYGALGALAAPDLTLMKKMGYDAAALGRDDFVYGTEWLAKMLSSAKEMPLLVQSNIVFPEDESGLADIWQAKNCGTYQLIEKGGWKIGVIALSDEHEAEGKESFSSPAEAASEAVASLKAKGADLVVCLYDTDGSEYTGAAGTDGIDLIIAGGSHTAAELTEAEGTPVVSCDPYGQSLGVVEINPSTGEIKSCTNVVISADQFEADASVTEKITSLRSTVQDKVMKRYGFKTDTEVFSTNYSLTDYESLNTSAAFAKAGDLLTDSMVQAYREPSEGKELKPVSITTEKQVTGTLLKGAVSANDLFSMAYKGMDTDGIPGLTLVKVYMTGADLRALCEADLNQDSTDENALHFGRMRYEYSTHRPQYDQVIDVYTEEADGYYVAATMKAVYPVITTKEVLDLIPGLMASTDGQLKCSIYDADGNIVTDYDSMIIRDDNGVAVKQWSAISEYIHHFERSDSGAYTLEDTYKTARKHSIENTSFDLIKLFKHAGKPTKDKYIKYITLPVAAFIVLNLLVILINMKKKKEPEE